MITLSNTTGFDSYTINRNPDGTVSIIINYNQDIQNMEITVEFDPSLSGHASLSQIDPASRTFNL
jgi:hypothetical protein